jgi:tetratricopeptide (TPR) repeat protein
MKLGKLGYLMCSVVLVGGSLASLGVSPAAASRAADQQSAEQVFDRGRAAEERGDLQAALADYTQAIALDPEFVTAYNNRAVVRYRLGDTTGALEDLSAAIRLDANDPLVYDNRAQVRARLGDAQGAAADWQRAANLFLDQGDVASYQRVLDTMQRAQAPAGGASAAALAPAPSNRPALTIALEDLPPGYREVAAMTMQIENKPVEMSMLARTDPGPGPRVVISMVLHDQAQPSEEDFARSRRQMAERFSEGAVRNQNVELSDVEELDASGLGERAALWRFQYREVDAASAAGDADPDDYGDGAMAIIHRGDLMSFLMVMSVDGRSTADIRQLARTVDQRMMQALAPGER